MADVCPHCHQPAEKATKHCRHCDWLVCLCRAVFHPVSGAHTHPSHGSQHDYCLDRTD